MKAEICGKLCVLVSTFLILSAVRASLGQLVDWVREPEGRYYVSPKQPANVTCEAYGVIRISFTCDGSRIPVTSQRTYETYDEARQQTLVRSSIVVTKSDLSDLKDGEDKFWCECSAWEDEQSIALTSTRATIKLAYLKKKFEQEPLSQSAEEGSTVKFTCLPPEGEPEPEIVWRRDGRRINSDEDSNTEIDVDGSLILRAVGKQDAGTFQCIVRNDAGRRESANAVLTVLDRATEVTDDESDLLYETTTPLKTDTAKPRSQRASPEPKFVEQPAANLYLVPGGSVSIVCDVRGAEILTFRCNSQRVDSDKLTTAQDRTARTIRSILNLTFAEVENYINSYQEEDYKCECIAWYLDSSESPGWKYITSTIGNVALASLETKFVQQPRDVSAQIGTEATLSCTPPAGKPSPWVYWVFESQRVDPREGSRYAVSRDGSLTIRNLGYNDAGRYYCVAENPSGFRQSEVASLTVTDFPVVQATEAPRRQTTAEYLATFPLVIPSSPLFTRDLLPLVALNPDGRVTLVCSVVAADMLTFRCNNVRLPADEQKVESLVDSASQKRLLTASTVVTRSQVEDSQESNYTCQCFAWYIEGGGGDWKNIASTVSIIRAPFLEDNFEFEPAGLSIEIGYVAELGCQAPKGFPTPTISWYKNGLPLDLEANSGLSLHDGGAVIIDDVRAEHAGEYVCVATNAAGSRRSKPVILEVKEPDEEPTSARPDQPLLTVTAKPASTTSVGMDVLDEPVFTLEPLPHYYVTSAEPAVLNCEVISAAIISFECNGQRVPSDPTRIYKTQDPESGYTLLGNSINVSLEDIKTYGGDQPYSCKCQAYYQGTSPNDWQFVHSQAATVEEAYLENEFEKEPTDQTVPQGQRIELVCRPPVGVPTPSVHWVVDGYRIQDDNNFHLTTEGSLIIVSVEKGDENSYTCVAENLVGSRYSQTVAVRVLESTPSPEPEPVPKQTKPATFLLEPDATYYIAKSKPVTITCQTRYAERISFNCNAENIPESRNQYKRIEDGLAPGEEPILEASIDISRDEVENYYNQSEEGFWCQCYARYTLPDLMEPQYLISSKGYVQVTYIKRNFRREPFDLTFASGEQVTLPCEAPEGNPFPTIYWLFNGIPVEPSRLLPDSSVLIDSSSEAGNYTCVAENIANVRFSRTAVIKYSTEGEILVPTKAMNDSRCWKLLTDCSSLMPSGVRDNKACQKVPNYVKCMDRYLNQCAASTSLESREAAIEAKESAERDCLPRTSEPTPCQELMACEHEYSKQSGPNMNGNGDMALLILCSGIQSYLKCADNAVQKCKIATGKEVTSLASLADWFEPYCNKLTEDQWAYECPALSKCGAPIDENTVWARLVQPNLWCSYIDKTVDCTARALESCKVEEEEDELQMLANKAKKLCYNEMDDDDSNSRTDQVDDRGTSKTTGATDIDTDNKSNEGDDEEKSIEETLEVDESTANDGTGRTATSFLLSCLLPVLFVFVMCR